MGKTHNFDKAFEIAGWTVDKKTGVPLNRNLAPCDTADIHAMLQLLTDICNELGFVWTLRMLRYDNYYQCAIDKYKRGYVQRVLSVENKHTITAVYKCIKVLAERQEAQ